MKICNAISVSLVLNSQLMGRGVSSGGGQSSLGYLFGSGETPTKAHGADVQSQSANGGHPQNVNGASPSVDKEIPVASPPVDKQIRAASPTVEKQIPAGIHGNLTNNYHRADGQNCGNFITVWLLITSLVI